MADKKAPDKTAPSQVQEVMDFMEAEERLSEFKQQHGDMFKQFEELAADYNQKLEAAEKVCRSKQISCGPFDLYQTQTTYDAKVLFDSLGRERFIQVGGVMNTITSYEVDKTRIEASISKSLIPSDVVEIFKKTSPRFHKPSKMEIS